MHYLDTYTRISRVLIDEFFVPETVIENESDLVKNFEFDSLDIVEFHMACEEEFQVEIGDDLIEGMLHVSDWVSVIDSLRKV